MSVFLFWVSFVFASDGVLIVTLSVCSNGTVYLLICSTILPLLATLFVRFCLLMTCFSFLFLLLASSLHGSGRLVALLLVRFAELACLSCPFSTTLLFLPSNFVRLCMLNCRTDDQELRTTRLEKENSKKSVTCSVSLIYVFMLLRGVSSPALLF